MRRDSIIITRRNIGQAASFVGGAALLVGVLALIWQGSVTAYVGVVLGVGVLGIALWAVMSPREFASFVTGRQARRSTTAVFSTLLLIGITALVYLLLQRAALTLDMTIAQRYTLSSETERVLQRVSRPIRITGFYSSRALAQREIDDAFFRLYETATNGLISRQYIDPDEQPALAQYYGVTEDAQVFVSYVNDDAEKSTNFATLARVPRGDQQERDMTQALSRLLIAGTLTVYFDVGDGERDPQDSTQEGISGINNGVRESGLVTYPLSLADLAAQDGDIPNNAATVVFARPLSDFTDDQIRVLDRYLLRGGTLLLLADVLFNDNPFLKQDGNFNQYLWANYGIRALDMAVVDPGFSGATALDAMSAYVFSDTDLGARLDPAQNPTMFRVARALEVNLENAPANIANGQVILSSEQSYGETDLRTLGETNTYRYDADVDVPGPLTTVVWSSNQTTGARIVLIGDSDFVSNGLILSGGNGVLFTDSMAWLTGLGEQITFAPQLYGVGSPLIFVSTQTLDLITFLTVILMPGAVLVTGVAIWMRRVRR
ncbi:MAG: Gldg family protein [Anaerolineae bacterium]|nr:Gldg family protein [Anaerolineae bacterium]